MLCIVHGFLRDETASAAVSYALIVALVSFSLLASVQGLGSSVNDTISVASDEVTIVARCVEVGSNCKK